MHIQVSSTEQEREREREREKELLNVREKVYLKSAFNTKRPIYAQKTAANFHFVGYRQ